MTAAELLAAYAAGRRDFRDADLAGAQLAGAHLAGARLAGARLAGAVLTRARLDGADLTRARLDGADLTGAQLAQAHLAGARLDGADLTGAQLAGARLDGARLTGARLTGARLDGAVKVDYDADPELGPRVADQIEQHPETHDQSVWHSSCGTAHCVAGWACLLHPRGRALEAAIGTSAAASYLLGRPDVSFAESADLAVNLRALRT